MQTMHVLPSVLHAMLSMRIPATQEIIPILILAGADPGSPAI